MLAIHYLMEFTQLYIVTFYILNFPKKNRIWILNICMLLLLTFIDGRRMMYLNGKVVVYGYDIFIYVGMALLIMFYGVGRLKSLPFLIIMHIFINLIGMIIVGFILTMLSIPINIVTTNPWYNMILGACCLILIIILSYWVKCFKLEIHVLSLGWRRISVIAISLIVFGFYMASFQMFGNNHSDVIPGKLVSLLATIGGLAVIHIILILIVKENQLKATENLWRMQEEVIQQQQMYYIAWQQQEEETRKFRHDIVGHFSVINELIKMKKYQILEKYMQELDYSMVEIQDSLGNDTGSDLVNAVLLGLCSQYKNSDITINWIGYIPNNMNITGKDLAVLFINLLKNAFESVIKCPENKLIEVQVKAKENYFYVQIKNSYIEALLITDEGLKTTKIDQEKHGYGWQIVQDIVRKYNGQVSFSSIGQEFVVEITFLKKIYQE